jgi:integrase
MASIDRRPNRKDKPWRVRWREYPGGPQKTRHFARKTDAQRFGAVVEADLVRGTYIDPSLERQRWVDYADEWAAVQDWEWGTWSSWEVCRKRLVGVLGDVPVGAVDRLRLQHCQKTLGERHKRSTVVTTMEFARAVMRAAYADGRIGRDPTVGLRMPRARNGDGRSVGPEQVPTRSEALAILAGAPARFRAAVALGLAGLRIGEVLGLTADRVTLETRQVTIDRQLKRVESERVLAESTKNEKVRTIAVPGIVAVELRRHLRDVAGSGLLFTGERTGESMWANTFYRIGWRPALVAAGFAPDRFKFHALRHFCASNLLAEGAPITAVAGYLGDAVPTVTRTYAHWLRDDREVPAAVLDRVLAPPASDEAEVAR